MDSSIVTSDSGKKQQIAKNEKAAYEKGYRFKNGKVISPTGETVKQYIVKWGYPTFSVAVGSRGNGTRRVVRVFTHRLAMYQRHGDLIYRFECIRHKDGNPQNNSYSNLRLGSQKQNMLDVPKKKRLMKSISAASKLRKFTDEEISEIRTNHTTYRKTMKKYGISSSGTLWYILNQDYVTTKTG